MMKRFRDFARVFSENWNRKLKSVRLLGAVVSLCMLVCAVLCMHSAVPMHQALKTAAALVIIALGMYQLVDYYYMPVLLRDGSFEYTCCCCFSDNPAHIHCDAEYGTCRLLGYGWNHIACGSGYHEKYEDRGCSGMNGDSRI